MNLSPSCFALIRLCANVPGKAFEDSPSTRTPVTHVGDPDKISASWLWPSSVLVIAAILAVTQEMEDIFLPVYQLSLLSCISN